MNSILDVLPDDERRRVRSSATRRRYGKGDILFHEGDPGSTFHLMQKGRVKVSTVTEAGDVAALTILGPGSSFGEQALLTPGALRTTTVVALEPTETLTLAANDFAALRETAPAVDRLLIEVLSAQVRRLTAQVREALYVPADQRIVRRLRELAALYRGADGGAVIPLTHEELAQLAGTTRPTVTRALKSLGSAVSTTRGRIEVRDTSAL